MCPPLGTLHLHSVLLACMYVFSQRLNCDYCVRYINSPGTSTPDGRVIGFEVGEFLYCCSASHRVLHSNPVDELMPSHACCLDRGFCHCRLYAVCCTSCIYGWCGSGTQFLKDEKKNVRLHSITVLYDHFSCSLLGFWNGSDVAFHGGDGL